MVSHTNCVDCGRRIDRRAGKERCQEHKLAFLANRRAERAEIKARRSRRAAGGQEGRMPMSISEAIADVATDREVETVIDAARRTNSFQPVVAALQSKIMHQIDMAPIDADLTASEKYQRDVAKRIAKLSDELKVEIGTFYERHEIPLADIAAEFGLHNSHVGAVARELGLPPRARGNTEAQPGRFDHPAGSSHRVWVPDTPVEPEPVKWHGQASPVEEARAQAIEELGAIPEPEPEPALPEAQVKALENMVRLPAPPEPRIKTRRASDLTFEATVHGEIRVQAGTMMDAMADLMRRYPDLRITAIREV